MEEDPNKNAVYTRQHDAPGNKDIPSENRLLRRRKKGSENHAY